LDRTIFIPDEENYRLPAYSEWGYNSFGAEYERDYFLASRLLFPCKIMYQGGMLHFSLNGVIRNNAEMSLLFVFPWVQIGGFGDLVQLNNVEINLSSDDCAVIILQDNKETILNIIDGKLHFKRAQLLTVDDLKNRTILSGVFDLQFLQNSFPSTISNGRFDVGIDKKVFYTYN
jgi:hypothetical protein